MSIARQLFPISLAFAVGGCSVYPLPQDTSGSTTSDIVANIRCQARRAVRKAAALEVRKKGVAYVTKSFTGNALADALENEDYDFDRPLKPSDFLDKNFRDAFAYYKTTLVTYEFTLQMNEDNKQGASINLLRKFTRRLDTIGVGVTEDRSRDTSRIFSLHDTFQNLVAGIKSNYCMNKPGHDLVFPARGRLPVEDLVGTYIYLNEWGTLDDAAKPDLEGTKKGPATRQMADTIMFTTKISTTNNPTIAYNPARLGFFVGSLGFTNENSRSDLHKVIITLTTTDVPDGQGDYKAVAPDELRTSGENAIVSVRTKNFQDDISRIARSLSQGGLPGL